MYTNSQMAASLISEFSIKKYTLFCAESCSGGLIAANIVSMNGASTVLLGGIIAYSNAIKQNILQVNSTTLATYGAVSHACLKEMLLGAKRLSSATHIIATSGFLSEHDPLCGHVFIGCITNNISTIYKIRLIGDRFEMQNKIVNIALKILLKYPIETMPNFQILEDRWTDNI